MEYKYRRQGLFKALTDIRFDYCPNIDLPILTATNIEFIKEYYEGHEFTVYRTTKNYWFLRRDRQEGFL